MPDRREKEPTRPETVRDVIDKADALVAANYDASVPVLDPAAVEAAAEALLNESRKSMFAIPIPLDRASGPGRKQYLREAEAAIAAYLAHADLVPKAENEAEKRGRDSEFGAFQAAQEEVSCLRAELERANERSSDWAAEAGRWEYRAKRAERERDETLEELGRVLDERMGRRAP